MASNETPDQQIERILQEHFSTEAAEIRAPGDLWSRLESRLGEQGAPPRFTCFRGWLFPVEAPRWTPAVALAAVAAIAVVAAGSVWLATGNGGGEDPLSTEPLAERPTHAPQATTLPMVTAAPVPQATALPRPPSEAATLATSAPATQVTAFPTPQTAPGSQGENFYRAAPPSATTFRDYARQPFVDTREDNVSTFSLDTDRTSFHLALNWAREGHVVDPASVRAEEWINAFDYGYAPPTHDDRFGISSDVMSHPLNDSMHLARIAFQAPELSDDTPLNVTLVLDASSSMAEGNRVEIAREAAETIRQSLDRRDHIAVVHYAAVVNQELTVRHQRPQDADVAWSIAQLKSHGSTNVQAGLDFGVRLADQARRDRPEAHNYIILMSDGVANVDATNPFGILESNYDPVSSNPLRIITIGVGIANYSDFLLEQIAQHGDGWYRYLRDTNQARSTFARDSWLALSSPFADQTRAQVVWDPETVTSWRIIGYENRVTSRVTSDESFAEDRKEFAEIPSGAATTVLYELELHGGLQEGDKLGEIEVRWLTPETGMSKSQITELRYEGNRRPRQAGPMLEFGALVALSADRYSGLGSSYDEDRRRDLSTLREHTRWLHGDLGHLQAYQDFSFLLDHIARSAGARPADQRSSGYSR